MKKKRQNIAIFLTTSRILYYILSNIYLFISQDNLFPLYAICKNNGMMHQNITKRAIVSAIFKLSSFQNIDTC